VRQPGLVDEAKPVPVPLPQPVPDDT